MARWYRSTTADKLKQHNERQRIKQQMAELMQKKTDHGSVGPVQTQDKR